jgi:hypothetical protein
MHRSKERTNTGPKTDITITPFPVRKSDTFFSHSSRTVRLTQSILEMVRKSKSNTSGWPTVARDAGNCIHIHTWDGQCFDSLGWRREMHNCLDDVPDDALRVLSNGIKLASDALPDAAM